MSALAGRHVVVGGASSGVGLAAAQLLHDQGASVVGVARRREAMEEGMGEARRASGRFRAHALDLTDAGAVRDAVGVLAPEGRLDLLVIAAGANLPERRLAELDAERWERLLGANLSGAFHLLRACLDALRAARGLVVAVSSVSAQWPDASGPGYQAAKAGMLALMRGAALEEQAAGVRFSCLLPGAIDTPLLEQRPEPPSAEARAGMLRASDVAEVIAYLAGLPERVVVPELTLLPSEMQVLGATGAPNPFGVPTGSR